MEGERKFINQLVGGQMVNQVFLVRDKDLRTTKSGGLYIHCVLCDKTGQMPGRLWQATESIYATIEAGGFLHVKGRVEDYRGALQIIVDACHPASADSVDMAEFLAVSEYDVEQMWAELLDIMREIKDKHLRLLIKKFISDTDLVAGYKRSPAAVQMHHAFIGGLLEHTLNIARAAKAMVGLYPAINKDLLLAGVFLHDIGKIAELSDGTAISYTDQGQLVGHITIAAMWISARAATVAEETGEPFPPKTIDLLQHIVLSHHGFHEFGSPKLPAIPEAFVLHYLDNLDAKMFMTVAAIENDPDAQASFTPYLRQLETRLYKHSGEL